MSRLRNILTGPGNPVNASRPSLRVTLRARVWLWPLAALALGCKCQRPSDPQIDGGQTAPTTALPACDTSFAWQGTTAFMLSDAGLIQCQPPREHVGDFPVRSP